MHAAKRPSDHPTDSNSEREIERWRHQKRSGRETKSDAAVTHAHTRAPNRTSDSSSTAAPSRHSIVKVSSVEHPPRGAGIRIEMEVQLELTRTGAFSTLAGACNGSAVTADTVDE
eukprot:6214539-Pleurochrysis_carterae.AAC.2